MIKDNFFGKMNLEESYFDLQKLRRNIKGKRKKKVIGTHFILVRVMYISCLCYSVTV